MFAGRRNEHAVRWRIPERPRPRTREREPEPTVPNALTHPKRGARGRARPKSCDPRSTPQMSPALPLRDLTSRFSPVLERQIWCQQPLTHSRVLSRPAQCRLTRAMKMTVARRIRFLIPSQVCRRPDDQGNDAATEQRAQNHHDAKAWRRLLSRRHGNSDPRQYWSILDLIHAGLLELLTERYKHLLAEVYLSTKARFVQRQLG